MNKRSSAPALGTVRAHPHKCCGRVRLNGYDMSVQAKKEELQARASQPHHTTGVISHA